MSRKLLYNLSFLAFSLVPGIPSEGQTTAYAFRHITKENGLASDNVLSISQDSKGFIWIGTDNGLQRYDGYNFTNFHHVPGDTTTLNTDFINQVWEDSLGQIWAGENIFDPVSGKCSDPVQPMRSAYPNPGGESTPRIFRDNLGTIWYSSMHILAAWDYRQKKFLPRPGMLPVPGGRIIESIYCDPKTKRMWMAGAEQLLLFDGNRNTYYGNFNNSGNSKIFSERSCHIFGDRQGALWLIPWWASLKRYGLDGSLIKTYVYDKSLPHKKLSALENNFAVTASLEDHKGSVWFYEGIRNQLIVHDPADDKFTIVGSDLKSHNGLHYDRVINCLFEDRHGYIWIGTDLGINIFNPYIRSFHNIDLAGIQKGKTRPSEIMAETQLPNGDIWVATWGNGLMVLDSTFRLKKNYSFDKTDRSSFAEPDNEAWSIFENKDGRIWIGGHHGLLSIFDPSSNVFSNSWPPELNHKTILQFVPDQHENIWMHMWNGGVAKWDPRNGRFGHCHGLDPYLSRDSSVSSIYIDSKNRLWVSVVNNGLVRINTETGACEAHYLHKNGEASISSNVNNCIAGINDSLLALGVRDGGIDLLNTHTGRVIKAYNTTNGLPFSDIEALYFQPPYSLWAAMRNSICKIDLRNDHIIDFGEEDGISNANFEMSNRMIRLQDGRLAVSYLAGLFSFDPDSASEQRPPEDPVLTGFSIFDKALSVDSIMKRSDTIPLSYKENFFTIRFASINYITPDGITYYYKLEGINKDWVRAGREHEAQYTNLPGGKYPFKIRCENRDGVPCPHITSFFIIIDPPFWRTTWFFCLLVAVFLAAVYAFYRYRIHQILQLQGVRNKISKDLHDDLGATLSSISVLSDMAKNSIVQGIPEESYSLISKINVYSREMVDKMRDIVWAINPSNDSLEKIIQRLKTYTVECCMAKEIAHQFLVEDQFRNIGVPMNARKNVYLICKEAIHNAVRHAACSSIRVQFSSSSSLVLIEIADNGKGFDTEGDFAGNGLINMAARAKEIKAELTVDSDAAGSCVRLQLIVPRFRE